MVNRLNKDQLDGLASLCFDLAKGAFGFSLFPTTRFFDDPFFRIIQLLAGVAAGLAFVYTALIILALKEKTTGR